MYKVCECCGVDKGNFTKRDYMVICIPCDYRVKNKIIPEYNWWFTKLKACVHMEEYSENPSVKSNQRRD